MYIDTSTNPMILSQYFGAARRIIRSQYTMGRMEQIVKNLDDSKVIPT